MKLDVETMIVGLRAEMSVQEIARRAGISRAHAHRLLAGEVRRPSYDTVMRLQNVQRSLGTTSPAVKVGGVTKMADVARPCKGGGAIRG